MEVALSQDSSYLALVSTDKKLAHFEDLLSHFLRNVFFVNRADLTPRVEFSLLQDPDAGMERPMVEIILPLEQRSSRLGLQHEFVVEFKEFLARNTENSDDFLEMRELQRHFMIIFSIE